MQPVVLGAEGTIRPPTVCARIEDAPHVQLSRFLVFAPVAWEALKPTTVTSAITKKSRRRNN
jgi:hypothetical protein